MVRKNEKQAASFALSFFSHLFSGAILSHVNLSAL
jgi:hypothetical protein